MIERNSFSTILSSLVGRCDHKDSLYLGSVLDAKREGLEMHVYYCKKCDKVYKSYHSLKDKLKYNGFEFDDGVLSIKDQNNDKHSIGEFIELISKGKMKFSRIELQGLLNMLRKLVNQRHNDSVHYQKQAAEYKHTLEFTQSILDNKDVVVEEDPFLEERVISKEESQINALSIMHTVLINNGLANVHKDLYKVFHTMISTFYGYEVMRKRWEWNQHPSGSYIEFKNRTKSRKAK